MIDAFLHPVSRADIGGLSEIHRLPMGDLVRDVQTRLLSVGARLGHVVWMDEALLREPHLSNWRQVVVQAGGRLLHSCLIDPRTCSARGDLRRARQAGFSGLVLHPIHQRIQRSDYSDCVALANEAATLGMFITVGCAYGTRDMARFQGVPLAIELSRHVDVPIIMGHGGGAKVLDAFLAAGDSTNLYLDCSFSLPYWLGSSVETDFAFAMRRLGDRWLYGSDAPFVAVEEALRQTLDFLDRHGFSNEERTAILAGNAERLWRAWQ